MSEESSAPEKSAEYSQLTTCPNCGKEDSNLVRLDSGLKLTLQKASATEIPENVCRSCLKDIRNTASLGAQELAKKERQANQASKLWKNRISLVKQSHLLLTRGDYSEAAQSFEKYLKILQVVSEKPDRKSLDPKDFHDHPKEITIICSVLWDLMIIYDANAKFAQRQTETAEILSKFLRFSPIYNGIICKAEKEVGKAKNPQAYRDLLKLCDAHASRCFIANEAFGSRIDPTVVTLCDFRDKVLKNSPRGRQFVAWYYRVSPTWAKWMRSSPFIKAVIRVLLRLIARMARFSSVAGSRTGRKGGFPLPQAKDS